MSDTVLFTYGHGVASIEETILTLANAHIELLVDVRTYPWSPRNRHFDREQMQNWLPAAGIPYRHEPRLGGRRRCPKDSPDIAWEHPSFRGYATHMRTGEFVTALDEVLTEAAVRRVAVMCSESVWWKCHRRMISDFTEIARGAQIRHLMHDGRLVSHKPIAGTRLREDGLLVYDGGQEMLPGLGAA